MFLGFLENSSDGVTAKSTHSNNFQTDTGHGYVMENEV